MFNMRITLNMVCWLLIWMLFSCSRQTYPRDYVIGNAYSSGTVWECSVVYGTDPRANEHLKEVWYVSGKEEVDGREYLRLYCQMTSQSYLAYLKQSIRNGKEVPDVKAFTKYYGGIRTEGGKVFYFPSDACREYLIYDFAANPGDTLEVFAANHGCQETRITVLRKSPTKFDGIDNMLLYTLSPNGSSDAEEWLSGIGSTIGPLDNINGGWFGGSGSKLVKVTMCGKTVYESKRRR